LSLLRTRLGRLIRDIRRKIAGQGELEAALEQPLWRAAQPRIIIIAPSSGSVQSMTRERLFFALLIAWSLIIPVGRAWRA
jgi:hypothetical protein